MRIKLRETRSQLLKCTTQVQLYQVENAHTTKVKSTGRDSMQGAVATYYVNLLPNVQWLKSSSTTVNNSIFSYPKPEPQTADIFEGIQNDVTCCCT